MDCDELRYRKDERRQYGQGGGGSASKGSSLWQACSGSASKGGASLSPSPRISMVEDHLRQALELVVPGLPSQRTALLKHPCQSTFPTPRFKKGAQVECAPHRAQSQRTSSYQTPRLGKLTWGFWVVVLGRTCRSSRRGQSGSCLRLLFETVSRLSDRNWPRHSGRLCGAPRSVSRQSRLTAASPRQSWLTAAIPVGSTAASPSGESLLQL